MNLKVWRKVLVVITFISIITTTVFITWKIVRKNNVEVESRTNSRKYKTIDIPENDLYKLVNYKDNNYVFNLHNTEYYLVHETLNLYPELANKEFSFSVDDRQYPKTIAMSISTSKATKWFYSIIY